ncbi:integrase family protein [Burkholderia contaminans]|uniref:hypothetical protein n=1 Tax=Burkholderia contaminans TaxID=488447 RepID=UPI001453587B|nr:hypothetical protein [Burkholderia contaminans]VWC91760.1 integrase family protein [Burkholderia contaminans]
MRKARTDNPYSNSSPNAAADLRRGSTHWLLHTLANCGLDASADIRDMQELLGDASLGTATLYTKTDAVRQFQSVETFFNAALDGADPVPTSKPSPAAAKAPPAPSPASHVVSVVAADVAPSVAVHVTLKVASKRAGGRGRARVLERVEREVPAGVASTPTRDGETVLQVPFHDDEAFDHRVDDLLLAIARTREQHRCISENEGGPRSPASAGAGECWPARRERWRTGHESHHHGGDVSGGGRMGCAVSTLFFRLFLISGCAR